ncbi:MAG: serine--tRNA ligase [Pirellulaceae bacterium]|nr:serine--tRNA ligase [Planctomycetaceae bacterium]MDG1807167.1 serine--tRNA ligase [Pirellulaceae bacterium]MDG2104967.1 serine--tRNA ligase [Pirellulaceae bacterium]
MLDRKFILENIAEVKQNCVNRGVTEQVDQLVEWESQRKAIQAETEELNRRANEVSKSIGKAKDAEEREARKNEGRELRAKKDAAQSEVDRLNAEILQLQLALPNMAHADAPVGVDDKANLEIGRGKHEPRAFNFDVLDHVELGQQHDWIDFEGGARTTGSGFYFIKGELVLLDLALQRFAVDFLMDRGFTPTITPDLATDAVLEGIGFMPRGPETQVYSIENMDLSLVGTAEITLGGLYKDQTLMSDELPLRLCGLSHCYRTEAGAAGRASRGLYRVHQFTKVEMFAFTRPDQSDAMHEELLQIERDLFDALEIPFRIVDTATGDLGGPAYRKYDLEAWMPGRGESGEWGEVTSTSNCTDYQARRLNSRFKIKDQKGTHFTHTLNGTALALSRALISILENHQNADGSVTIPEAIRSYVRRDKIG